MATISSNFEQTGDGAAPNRQQKLAYLSPKLSVYGLVADLTGNAAAGTISDGATSGNMTMQNP